MTQEETKRKKRGSSIYGKTREKLDKSRPINVTALKLFGQLEKIEAPTAKRLKNGYSDIQDDEHLSDWCIHAQAYLYYTEISKIYTPESRKLSGEYLRTTDVNALCQWCEEAQIYLLKHQLQLLDNDEGNDIMEKYVSYDKDPDAHLQWIKSAETYLKKNA